jgi:hypothetical protein
MRSINYICLVALLLVTGSCSVQKRNYQKGYYVNWFHKKNSNTPEKHSQEEKAKGIAQRSINNYETNNNIIASQKTTDDKVFFESINKPLISIKDTCGDRVIYKNGDEVLAKVLEIDDTQIKYKRCDNLNGPLFSVSKQKIEMIIYSNGVKETIISSPVIQTPNQIQQPYQEKETPPSASIALAFAILGLFLLPIIGTIVSLIFAEVAGNKIRSNPQKYDGMELVKAAKIIDWIVIALIISIILIFVVLLSLI